MPLSANRFQIPLRLGIRPLVIGIMATLLVMFILMLILKDWELAGLLSYILMIFICFGGLLDTIGDGFLLNRLLIITLIVFWVALFISILNKKCVWKKLCTKYPITPFLNVVTGALLILPIINLIGIISDIGRYTMAFQDLNKNTDPEPVFFTNQYKPDIYYIILDGYGRADILEDLYKFDNSALLTFSPETIFLLLIKAIAITSRQRYHLLLH